MFENCEKMIEILKKNRKSSKPKAIVKFYKIDRSHALKDEEKINFNTNSCSVLLEQPRRARNRVRIGLPYRPEFLNF
jgi:hypothetical protein